MNNDRITPSQRMAAYRGRQRASGRMPIYQFISKTVIDEINRIKVQEGFSSREPIIEEALRTYIQMKTRA